uniref:Uncharacterized protein n=1 Tax=Anguilla anguilla TaxID=7936 RepID=A0A0E9QNW0_ANGAN
MAGITWLVNINAYICPSLWLFNSLH